AFMPDAEKILLSYIALGLIGHDEKKKREKSMMQMRLPSSSAAAVILAFMWGSHVCADPGKLDAAMRRALEAVPPPAAVDPRARSGVSTKPQMIAASVRFSGDALDLLRARGVLIRSALGDVATVDI